MSKITLFIDLRKTLWEEPTKIEKNPWQKPPI